MSIVYTPTQHLSSSGVFTYRTYPAEIKGGQAMFQVRVGNYPVLSQGTNLDILISYDEEALKAHGIKYFFSLPKRWVLR